jgi:PilZ domain-containing protein
MRARPKLLVLGDPGPVRHDLLPRGDLEVFWVSSVADALTIVRSSPPLLCLVSLEIGVEEAIYFLECTCERRYVPSVLIVDPNQEVAPGLIARSSAIVSIDCPESILAVVAFHTGLAFARDKRSRIEAPVRVFIDRDEYVLEASNISVSGIAIRNFPHMEIGRIVALEIELPTGTVPADARVVRFGSDPLSEIAGLTFVRITPFHREKIRRVVEGEEEPASMRASDLFGDITVDVGEAHALRTIDIRHTSDLQASELDPEPELGLLRAYVATGSWHDEPPGWLIGFAGQITGVEIAVLLDLPSPEWAVKALSIRMCLERLRTGPHQAKVPSVLADEAYRIFEHLKNASARGADPTLVADVAKIRAGVLRSLLSPVLTRSGATIPPLPMQAGPDERSVMEDLGQALVAT